MSPQAGSPRGWRGALTTALCALGTVASLHALTNLLGLGPWRNPVVLLVLVVAAVTAVVRAVTRSAWAPSVLGLVAAVAAVLLRYGAPPGRVQLVPDLSSWDRTSALWGEALRVVDVSTVPVDVTRPLELLLAAGALAVFLAADLLAAGLGMTAWTGLAFAAMWTPTIALGFPARGSALFWTGLVYLLLLALSAAPQAGTQDDRVRRSGLASVASLGVVAVALVAGPPLAALPGWSSWGLPDLGRGGTGAVNLSSDLDVRSSLGERSGDTVLRYTTEVLAPSDTGDDPAPTASPTSAPNVSAATIGPLRSFTLLQFDGRSWRADEPRPSIDAPFDGLLATDPDLLGRSPSTARGTLAAVHLEVGALRDRELPIATFPRTLQIDGRWSWDAARDSITGTRPTDAGMTYDMVVEIPTLTSDDLEDARVGDPGDARALEVPPTSHAADIAALAADLTAEAETPYEQAMALQSYLRSAANFTYDTRVDPARTDDAVWDFLESRKGYCVQFATAMTVMSRSLGIPARVGVGFLPGQVDGDEYVVTGRQAHAWPELYFEGQGWVRFEPTPAVQTGAPPRWSDPFANVPNAGPTQEVVPTGRPGAVPTGRPNSPSAPGEIAEQGTDWVPAALTAALVLALGAVGATVLVRRRSRLLADLTPEQAWARLRRVLARNGVRWSSATTPRAAAALVPERVADLGGSLDAPALEALIGLARAVEQARYAPAAANPEPGQLAAWIDDVHRSARRTLGRRTIGRPRRARPGPAATGSQPDDRAARGASSSR